MAGNCKYYKREMYVSMDSGQTWSGTGVYSQGALIESASTDCEHDYSTQYLTFRPNGDTEYWFSYGVEYGIIYYSLNSGSTWTSLGSNQHTVTVHSGDTIMWRGELRVNSDAIGQFHSSGSTWEVEGNIVSVMYGSIIEDTGVYAGELRCLFSGCTGMTSAENLVLQATTLEAYCYEGMFKGCTNLTTAPTLPALGTRQGCYYQMFSGCTNLSSVTCLATDIYATECTSNWLDGVASTGTFYCPSSTQWSSGSSGIPNGWTRVNI